MSLRRRIPGNAKTEITERSGNVYENKAPVSELRLRCQNRRDIEWATLRAVCSERQYVSFTHDLPILQKLEFVERSGNVYENKGLVFEKSSLNRECI